MTVRELREKYLRFFESKGHLRFPAASLVPYDVTGRLDESLLLTGAGMIQFKPYFRGIAKPEMPRLVTCQPCVRTGDIDEVGDATHLSFFEMLGNFSFGDYFKAQAIAFSWEFITDKQWLGLDTRRLSFSVFEEDEEAYNEWSFWLTAAGIDPDSRIFKLDEDSNYWPAGAFSKGPPGPCGPNSEMFYWVSSEEPPSAPYSREQWIQDEADHKWVEFWNDVFIQYDWKGHLKDPSNPKLGYEKDGMPDLPFQSIDTGLGLDRAAIVLGGYDSIWDIDVFQPILAKVVGLRGEPIASEKEIRAQRIIADHTRTAVFCIADGILPGNTGRGYVLRRLIRRAVLQGQRVLGFDKPFLEVVFEGVLESMGDFYTNLHDRRDMIVETLKNEEALFRRTLANGIRLLEEQMASIQDQGATNYDGAAAFVLYDTYGFPLEVTQEILSERGFTINTDAYDQALRDAQQRSRGAQDRESVYGGVTGSDEIAVADAPEATDFLGYSESSAKARIVRVRPLDSGLRIALDQTPFYAESGGQMGDKGTLTIESGPLEGTVLEVTNTTKSNGIFWHDVKGGSDFDSLLGQSVSAQVYGSRRDRIKRNHTATHLLQAALRQVLGTHVTQAGSAVGPDNLRFDFTHGKGMTPDELEKVEWIVNEQALANTPVTTYVDLPIDEARAKGAMALFGEKYGNKVRMVEIGDFSRELCGGIHVRTTGEVGLFKIVSEASAASGVRRIEAITGESAYQWVLEETKRIREAAALLKASPRDLVPAIERVVESAKEERRKREKAEVAAMGGGGKSTAEDETVAIGPIVLWRRSFGEVDAKLAANAVDNEAAGKANQVTFASLVSNGKPQFICKIGPEAVSAGCHAGNLLRELSKIAGGGGGGRPDFATAGGKDPEKVAEAMEVAVKLLAGMVGVSAD